MARKFVATSSQYLSMATPAITAVPMTFVYWARVPDTSGTYSTVTILDTSAGSDAYWTMYANAGVVSAEVALAPTYDLFSTTTSYRANVWHHHAAVFAGNADRTVYLDAGGTATDTTSVTPTPGLIDAMQIGAYVDAGFTSYSNLELEDVAIYNAALSFHEIYLLARGRKRDGSRYRPWDIRPANLVSCPILDRGTSVPDRIAARGYWTVNGGASPLPTPSFLLPQRRTIGKAPAGGGGGTTPKNVFGKVLSGPFGGAI